MPGSNSTLPSSISYARKSVFLLFKKCFFPWAKQPGLLGVLLLVSLSFACQTQTSATSTDTRAADEATLRKLDDEWSKAAGAKDLEKTVSFYSDDTQILPPNSPVLHGKDAARAMWKGMFAVPGFGGGWKATKVEVAQSGDLGWTTGPYEITEVDAKGKPMTDKGKYLAVWKKQADGSWKCVADMFNTDLPPAAAPPALKSN
jgi:ketosteroid isomerase-like protein